MATRFCIFQIAMKASKPTYNELKAYTQELEDKLSKTQDQRTQSLKEIWQQLPFCLLYIAYTGEVITSNTLFLDTFHFENSKLPGHIRNLLPNYTIPGTIAAHNSSKKQHLNLVDGNNKKRTVSVLHVLLKSEKKILLVIEDLTKEKYGTTSIQNQQNTIQQLTESNQALANQVNTLHQEIARLQEQFHILDENLPGVVYLCLNDEQFTMLHINEKIKEITGVSKNAFLNKEIDFTTLIHPDDKHIIETINSAVQFKKPFYLLYRLRNTNGEWVWVEEFGSGVFQDGKLSHLEGFILKIDERKHYTLKLKKKNRAIQDLNLRFEKQNIKLQNLNEELEASESRYKSLVQQIDYGMMVLQQGKVVFCNTAAEQIMLADKSNKLQKIPIENLFPNATVERLNETSKTKKCIKYHLTTLKNLQGKSKKIQLSATPIDFYNEESTLLTFHDVTSEIETRQKLKENELRYRQVFQAAGSGMAIFNPKQGFLMVNDKFVEITGYTQQDIKNEIRWEDILPNEVQEQIEARLVWATKLKDHHLISQEVRIRTKSNGLKTAFLQISMLPETNEFIASIVDLTHQYKAWEQVRKLQRAIEQSPTAIVVTNKAGRIEYVNPKFEQLTGYPLAECVGKKPNVLKASVLERSYYNDIKLAIKRGNEWRGEVLDKRKDGSSFWVDLSISPVLDENQQIQNIILIEEDISKRKALEEKLWSAKNRAEESDKLKSTFLANMSHEIRTPMNGILGFAQLLRQPNLTEDKIREYVAIIDGRGKHLLRVIQDIIDISKIESQQVKLHMHPFSLNTLMEDLYQYFNEEAKEKGLQLIVDKGLKVPKDNIMSDNYKIQQVLTNLIHNAIKYTEQGVIQVGYKIQGNKQVLFYVSDTGVGIPHDQQQVIFERFRQADNTYTRTHGGTGLGLSICQGLITLLGGKIWVESTPEKGSIFKFTIPWHAAGMKDSFADVKNKSIPNWQDKTILIVEDDPASMELISTALAKTQAHLAKAVTGYQAIEQATKHQPDIILMDIQLPEMDGLIATKRIKKLLPHTPIIAQTAHAFANDKQMALKQGCTDYISKPLNIDKLIQLLRKYLGE